MRFRMSSVLIGAMGLVMVMAGPASAEVMSSWQMNEVSGRVMNDSSPNGLDGVIGRDVEIGERTPDGGRAYRFRNTGPRVNDERLVEVPDNPKLDPQGSTYAVTIRVKTGSRNPNIIQKGQARTTGGYWKFVMKKGWPRCHFRDGQGNTLAIGFVKSPNVDTILADRSWHTVRCERTARGVKVTMDYGSPNAITRFKRGSIGPIDNKFPLTIGGKRACNGDDVTCDYYTGAVDWVRIEKG